MWNCKGARIAKTTLKMKNKVGELELSDFETYSKASVFKMVWYWLKDWHIYQGNRIRTTDIYLNIYGQEISEKDIKAIQ